MSLSDAIQDDASTVFVSTSDFAEAVTYVPSSGSTRSINAVVIRQTVAQVPEGGFDTPVFEVHVANSATLGVSSAELNVGADAISIPVRIGDTATARTIVRLIDHDAGMLVLECR